MTETIPKSPTPSYEAALHQLEAQGQARRCRVVEPVPGKPCQVLVEGQPAVNFSSNDYLGLAHDPRLAEAAIHAIRQYGTGSSASRLISGTNELITQLETALADFKQTEAALVFNSGYQANVAILQALLEPGDWVFADKLNHASLVDGCMLSGARWSRYQHLDMNHLAQKLQKASPEARKWIVTDSVFSMDGDYPDLEALVTLAEKHNAFILVDEAHATGLYGKQRSSGLCEELGVGRRVTLQMGTFSKALGGSGAYVAGSKTFIDTLINKARGFIYSTALPPATIGAALEAVRLVQTDSRMKARLWENVRHFQALLGQHQLDAGMSLPLQSPIVPIIVGDSARTLQISETLLRQGYFVQGIRPPTVPAGTGRLRVALSTAHTTSQLDGLAEALTNALH